jgi:rod shape-determining protein MreC
MVRRQTLYLLLVLCLGHILLISAQVQSKSGLPLIHYIAFGGFAQLQRVTAGTADGGRGVWRHYFGLRGAAQENERLRQENLELRVALQQQQAIAAQTNRLEQAVGLKETYAAPTLAARVIAGNPSPGVLTVMIDRGADDGVKPDMAVIGSRGVVGRVVRPVAPRASTVQLLIDTHAAAAVAFERSQAGALVAGVSADPPLAGRYVPVLADIQVGERVITSGQDGVYPSGLLVGTVERVSRTGNAEREVMVRPAVDFSHVDVVFVVLGAAPSREEGAR